MYENPYNVPEWKKLWRRFCRWFSGLGWIITAIVLFVSLMVWLDITRLRAEEKSYKAFMFDCTKDHKEYECNAMWRQANPKKETTYIYFPLLN